MKQYTITNGCSQIFNVWFRNESHAPVYIDFSNVSVTPKSSDVIEIDFVGVKSDDSKELVDGVGFYVTGINPGKETITIIVTNKNVTISAMVEVFVESSDIIKYLEIRD